MHFKRKKIVFKLSILLFFCYLAAGCATTRAVRIDENITPRYLVSEEKDILYDSQKFEELLEKNCALYNDEALDGYLNGIVKKVAPKKIIADNVNFNVKVIKDPTLNAFALGNGSIYVHTGLLARLQNEAELVFILSHETSHIVNRDIVYFIHDYHNKTIAVKVIDLAITGPAAFFGVSDLTGLGLGTMYAASVTGYGRSIEARADQDGLNIMADLGYSPQEAVNVFETFLAEEKKYKQGMEIYFLSSHPSNKKRITEIKETIEKKYANVSICQSANSEKFMHMVSEVKIYNASLDIDNRRLYHALDTLAAILEDEPQNKNAHYYMGEVYRLLAENPEELKYELSDREWGILKKGGIEKHKNAWESLALEEYNQAISVDATFSAPYRGLGLFYKSKGDNDNAKKYFEKYLALGQNANDKRCIESYLKELNKNKGGRKE